MVLRRKLKNFLLIPIRPWAWGARPLKRDDLPENPLELFEQWFNLALRSWTLQFPDAFCLSTLDDQGYPDGRFVLLKGFDEKGFVFYTNTRSIKGRALEERSRASLACYWEPWQRQVRIQGDVEPVTAEEADEYYRSRPRGSQIGAWASLQSEPLNARRELLERVKLFEKKFTKGEVPRPKHWSGFRLIPSKIEFWQLRASRLHDRFIYQRVPLPISTDSEQGRIPPRWEIKRLYP